MEEDVLNALRPMSGTVYAPGTFDRDGKIIIIVNVTNDFQTWQRKCLELSVAYLKRSLSDAMLQKGATVIVDAQRSTARVARQHVRIIYELFEHVSLNLFLVKAECFWEKHVETCTKSHTKGEPIVLSRARLSKFFDLGDLPEELGGTLQFSHELWLQQRKAIDEFETVYEQTLSAMDGLNGLLNDSKTLRATEADAELKRCAQVHATVQHRIEAAIEMGNRILMRFSEVYALPSKSSQLDDDGSPTATEPIITSHSHSHSHSHSSLGGGCSVPRKPTLPLDLNCERVRLELRLNEIEKRQTAIRTAWLELLQCVREARELAALEEGVAFVTNWILNNAEQMLNRQHVIGCDVRACESLRSAHDALELECRETYGFYAELLYKIESYGGSRDCIAFRDLISQKDFMQFVCRAFATRLERRRNILITSLRFFRLVTEYFDRTSDVFESLVMGGHLAEDFSAAATTLQSLKDSQQSLGNMERELVKEGEKLSDMLAMPVKDALGRDLHIDYSDDICNIREILETTLARRKIFGDSVELQKLTLEQMTHIHAYEQDARMAIKWMDDLYAVMIRCHSHVGCNIDEIQVQKDELLTFQETGKSIYNYGCQLLEASRALRGTCKLDTAVTQQMSEQLRCTWHSLQAISHEHMTRLRVSAVFHRSVEEYCQQLMELRHSLRALTHQPQLQQRQHYHPHQHRCQDRSQQRGSSSGVSSESESQSPIASMCPTTPASAADGGTLNDRRSRLHKCLAVREQLLLEVGRMVRLGRLLKTRLKEPFILDAATGKSIVVQDLNAAVSTASPSTTATSTTSSSDATGTTDTSGTTDSTSSPTIVVNPVGNNALACNAISAKLTEIAEVAESLDTVIRNIQDDSVTMEEETAPSADGKNVETLPQNGSEDSHSRSTEDESFVSASEGNLTPHSHSSFQTASGHTSSSLTSSDKNRLDSSEADDSTISSDMPKLTPSPLNISAEESDQSCFSSQQQQQQQQEKPTSTTSADNFIQGQPRPPQSAQEEEGEQTQEKEEQKTEEEIIKTPTELSKDLSADEEENEMEKKEETKIEDQSSVPDVEELHSESVTPIPDHHVESIPIESETELDLSGIADAPSMEILTETVPMTSVTPEVSACPNQNQTTLQQPSNSRTNKPNVAWRRSKYYENITKQTIRGFL